MVSCRVLHHGLVRSRTVEQDQQPHEHMVAQRAHRVLLALLSAGAQASKNRQVPAPAQVPPLSVFTPSACFHRSNDAYNASSKHHRGGKSSRVNQLGANAKLCCVVNTLDPLDQCKFKTTSGVIAHLQLFLCISIPYFWCYR